MTGIPSQYRTLIQAIEYANQSHQVISQNLANVNTPNYEAREIPFAELLKQLDASNAGPVENLPQFEVQRTPGLVQRADGNNVDLDTELANLKKNDLAHQTLTQLLSTQMGMMRKAITG